MTVLIKGPDNSGKSEYAEGLFSGINNLPCFYIATLIPYGIEGQSRVIKHRKQREGKGFVTIERPFFVSGLTLPCGAAALLEDASNLLANAMFEHNQDERDVYTDIINLCAVRDFAVVVTIGGLSARSEYDAATNNYINALNNLNERLAAFADRVIDTAT